MYIYVFDTNYAKMAIVRNWDVQRVTHLAAACGAHGESCEIIYIRWRWRTSINATLMRDLAGEFACLIAAIKRTFKALFSKLVLKRALDAMYIRVLNNDVSLRRSFFFFH